MVEVDVFWTYGIGSGFALAAFRQLRKLQAENGVEDSRFDLKDMLSVRRLVREIEKKGPAFNNEYFMKTLLFLALLFVPSGAVLLWSNPSWETMHEGKYDTIPPWLVAAFNITNVTQGILGYWITYNLLMRGKYRIAALQTVLAYFGMFFILANGWDKTGYQRFFSASRKDFENWDRSNVSTWLTSDVVKILLSFGLAFIPLLLYWLSKWLLEGYQMEEGAEAEQGSGGRLTEALKVSAYLLTSIFGLSLGSAVSATLLIRRLGWARGLLAFAAVFYTVVLSKMGAGAALCRRIMRVDSLEGSPVWEMAE